MHAREAAAQLGRAQFIDVRKTYEWDAGHIEGAVHITLQEVPGRFEELDSSRPVIVTCQVGQRSALAANFLRQQGFDAHNLEGGLEAWVQEGLPLVGSEDDSGDVVAGRPETLDG